MLEKEKLRKADVYSGIVIFLFGAWIVWQASKMPMKDSWGGVQNVWFVSPALFPLFVGAMIMLLGLLLVRTALKTIGLKAFGDTLQWLFSKNLLQFLNTVSILRFYAIAVLFLAFVFLKSESPLCVWVSSDFGRKDFPKWPSWRSEIYILS